MNYEEEQELLRLTRENNYILKQIYNYINSDNPSQDMKEFAINVIANLISNR